MSELTFSQLQMAARYALERCLESQTHFADQLDAANHGDAYASMLVREDVALIREWMNQDALNKMTRERDAWRKLVMEHNKRYGYGCDDCRAYLGIVIPPELEQTK